MNIWKRWKKPSGSNTNFNELHEGPVQEGDSGWNVPQKLPQLTEIINGLYMNLNLTVDSQTKFFKELDYRVILFEFQWEIVHK